MIQNSKSFIYWKSHKLPSAELQFRSIKVRILYKVVPLSSEGEGMKWWYIICGSFQAIALGMACDWAIQQRHNTSHETRITKKMAQRALTIKVSPGNIWNDEFSMKGT